MYLLTSTAILVLYMIFNQFVFGVIALVQTNPASSAGSFSLLFTTGTRLSFFTPKNYSKSILSSNVLSRTTRVEYYVDAKSTQIFWYDSAETQIFRGYLTETGVHNISTVATRGVADVKEMTIDRFSQNIYWVDGRHRRVEVAKLDGTLRSTMVTNVNEPNGIDVDPELGYLFWSSGNGTNYFIERSFLNGAGSKTIVSDLNFPIVFTLDCHQKAIYWTNRLGILCKTDYEGRNTFVLGKFEVLASAYSIAFWNDTIYWTDNIHQTVSKMQMENPSTAEVLTLAYPQLYSIKIFHPAPSLVVARSRCLFDNGGCSHLCLGGKNFSSSCHCPYGLQIGPDHKTCIDRKSILGYATRETDASRFYFVDRHQHDEWIFPPLTISTFNDTSFAIDSSRNELYWISGRMILKQSASYNSSAQTVIQLGYFEPRALSFDWMSGNLFMLLLRNDGGNGTLSVASRYGKFFTHVIWKDFYKPGLLSIDSKNKILFWSHTRVTNGNSRAYYIESCFSDGSERKIRFSSILDNLNALATDPIGKQACWLTTRNFDLACVSYDGEHQTILSRPKGLTGISSVKSFSNGLLFYSDETESIKAFNVSSNHEFFIDNLPSDVSYMTLFGSDELLSDSVLHIDNEFNGCLSCHGSRNGTSTLGYEKPFLLYLTELSEPHSISVDDEQAPDVFPSAIFQPDTSNLVEFVAAEDELRYFWVSDERRIRSVRQDGTDLKLIFEETNFPITGIAVDWIAGNLYWSVSERSAIWVSRLTGDYPYIVVHRVSNPTSLAVHSAVGLLFWKECLQDCTIKRSTLAGQRQFTLPIMISEMGEMSIDTVENRIYWLSRNGLERADVDGNGREVIISSSPVSFSVGSDSIYWIDGDQYAGWIMKRSKTGNVTSVNGKTVNMARRLLLISKDVRQGINPCSINNGGCQHLCFYEGDQRYSCRCSFSSLAADKKTCTGDMSYILLANRDRIDSLRADDVTDPNPPKRSIIPHPSVRNIVSLCYHRGIVYFSDLHQSPFLFSINLDGSNFQPILIEKSVARQIEGIAFEEELELLLWTDTVTPSIGQYDVATHQERTLFQLKLTDKPRGIAVSNRKLFWTNWNDLSPKIETAFLNGSNHRTLLYSTLGRPNGLTIDGDHLFWTDSSADIDSYWISSCGLDGSNSRILYAGTGGHPFDIVVFGRFLFWTDWGIGAVWKAHWHGPPQVQFVLKNLTRPLGLTNVHSAVKEYELHFEEDVHLEKCENGCSSNASENPSSCEDCTEPFFKDYAFTVHPEIYVSITGIALFVIASIFYIRRFYKRRLKAKRKRVKNNIRQMYKPRLNSTDSDRLTMDAIVVNCTYDSHRLDDRILLITEST